MTSKTIDCVDCGESVAYGRLSCPACGALLASVAGAHRLPAWIVTTPEQAVATVAEPEGEPVVAPAAAVEPAAEPEHEPMADAEPEAVAEPAAEPEQVADPEAVAEPEPEPFAEPAADAEPAPERIAAAVGTLPPPDPDPSAPDPTPWPPLGEHEAVLAPRPYQGFAASARGTMSNQGAGYRPPAFALSAATAGGPAWPAGAVPGGSGSLGARDEELDTEKTDDAIEIDPAARYVEIAGWFVIVGAALSALGFLLPWSRVVIGAAHTGGYLDTWGLASPTHVVALAGLLVVLGLGIIETRVPAWLRSGVLGLAAGSLLIGLVWPYVVGPLGADVGRDGRRARRAGARDRRRGGLMGDPSRVGPPVRLSARVPAEARNGPCYTARTTDRTGLPDPGPGPTEAVIQAYGPDTPVDR